MATNSVSSNSSVQNTDVVNQTDTSIQNNNNSSSSSSSAASSSYSGSNVNTAENQAYAADAASANTKSYADTINQINDAAYQQSVNKIDYETNKSINDTIQTYEDSKQDYTDQYHSLTNQLYQCSDNAALNSRASGQFGGTATQNVAAARNSYQSQRQQLALKQQQVATQAVREIEQLRSQGEFDKADALLTQTQTRLSQLMEDATRRDEALYSNWQYQSTNDREDAAIERETAQANKEWNQSMGLALLQVGVMPDENILADMGMSKATAQSYINMTLYGYDLSGG